MNNDLIERKGVLGFCESELIDPSRSPERGVSSQEAEAYFTGYEAAVEHIRSFVTGLAAYSAMQGEAAEPTEAIDLAERAALSAS